MRFQKTGTLAERSRQAAGHIRHTTSGGTERTDARSCPATLGKAKMKTANNNRRWPGTVLSLIVPGFGLIRAGCWSRGFVWLVGLQVAAFLAGWVAAKAYVPIGLSYFAVVLAVCIQIVMWCDSFRSGRMTWKLWCLFVFLACLIILLPSSFEFTIRPFKMAGGSMEPTILGARSGRSPDHLIVDRSCYWFVPPKRGDLVVFSTSSVAGLEKDAYLVKRLVGMPGERIEIKNHAVYANGKRLTEENNIPPIPYVIMPVPSSSAIKEGTTFTVGSHDCFVLGDNPANSYDSRYWGGLPIGNVIGKVSKIYYPFERVGHPKYSQQCVAPSDEMENSQQCTPPNHHSPSAQGVGGC